ncbi:glycosyltransferase [Streptomyces sp. NPDC050085]|uniref:glycosyltransferase n=1 Tax=Streptomyces sp. NPDC050085 TaxID=3365600 RepID=UPI00379AA1E1
MNATARPARRVTVVQPYLTGYRVPFFERLRDELADRDVELTVAHGRPVGGAAERGDSVRLPGAVELPQRDWQVRGRHLVRRDLRSVVRDSDALILTQALHHLDSLALLARRPRGLRIGLWGHGRTYTVRHSAPARWAKAALTRRADWFFAYTDEGRAYAEDAGLPAGRVTVLDNSLDTRSLEAARDRVTEVEVRRLRSRHGLTPGLTGLYVGGLDAPKRTPFLLAAADELAARLPGFRLLVAGDGAQRAAVERHGPHVVHVGVVGEREKALLGAAADVMLVPGAVGLCAVDSFALRTPLVTTPWPFHGPEFGYLDDGRNAVLAPDDPGAYAAEVAQLLTRPRRLACLRRSCRADAQRYTVEAMARRFAAGVDGLLGTRAGGSGRDAGPVSGAVTPSGGTRSRV